MQSTLAEETSPSQISAFYIPSDTKLLLKMNLLTIFSDFLAGHDEICPPHGRSTWRPADQPTTRRSTWISCMVFFRKARIHVDRRLVGWSAGRHVDHPCGGQISRPARNVTNILRNYENCSDIFR